MSDEEKLLQNGKHPLYANHDSDEDAEEEFEESVDKIDEDEFCESNADEESGKDDSDAELAEKKSDDEILEKLSEMYGGEKS